MKQLLQILLDRLNEIPGFRNVELFNNQLQQSNGKNEAVLFPALYLELAGTIEYESGLGDYQYGTATIRVHVVDESPLQGTDTSIYDLKARVNAYLHKYTTGYFNGLVRTREELDTNHDNLFNYKIEYTTRFTELIQLEPDDVIEPFDIQIDYDLYDDGDEIITDLFIGETSDTDTVTDILYDEF